jgi:DNA-binding transcriptional LysR family regulator
LLVAPPELRAQAERMKVPEDISQLPFVAYAVLREPLRWHFSLNELERREVDLQAALSLDGTLPVREAVLLGAGLSVLPDYAIADDLAAGRLIHVLPRWHLPSGGIHVVFPTARFRPPKVRAFVELLAQRASGM